MDTSRAMKNSLRNSGFTIIEILVVVTVIAIIAALVISNIPRGRERAYLTRSQAELTTLATAARLYAQKYDVYPEDVSRSIPAEIKEFIAKGNQGDEWPDAPWPNSVYDYESWDIDGDTKMETIQISIRFCPVGGPIGACKFPSEPWATGFGINSAYYYCIKGYCRSHQSEAVSYPGYCYNCIGNQAVKLPTE